MTSEDANRYSREYYKINKKKISEKKKEWYKKNKDKIKLINSSEKNIIKVAFCIIQNKIHVFNKSGNNEYFVIKYEQLRFFLNKEERKILRSGQSIFKEITKKMFTNILKIKKDG